MKKRKLLSTKRTPKAGILGIHAPYNKTKNITSYFDEFVQLVKSSNTEYAIDKFIKIRSVDSAHYFTSGKLEEIKEWCEENDLEYLIISESLTALQARNLQDYIDIPVTDRTELILEIFEKAAHSAEGKTQVEIAILQHQKPRLAGKGVYLEQQAGVTGVRGGPGETLKERERRYIEQKIVTLKKQLKTLQKTRETQRKRRLESKWPLFCLIGYTNAGKSTILNALTKSDVLAEDKLFATLDTTTRELYVNSTKKGLMSDTVGFIQQLPTQLIEAFKSTLSELQYADLLLLTVDLSDPDWQNHIQVVHKILHELDVDKEILYVFNKIDQVDDLDAYITEVAAYQPHVLISAQSKTGLLPLINFLSDWHK